jgi:hypothetical protein
MRGKATTAAARTVAGQEKTIVRPIVSRARPTGDWRPKRRRRKKPTTVGGRTSGRVRTPSSRPRKRERVVDRARAARMPVTKAMTVAVVAVARERRRGDMVRAPV